MKQSIHSVSSQGFNFLFKHLEKQQDKVLWLRSADYKKQLYISNAYEHIWGQSCESLYQCPDQWALSLIDDKKQEKLRYVGTRYEAMQKNQEITENIFFYKISQPNGDIQYIKDSCIPLYHENDLAAVMGIGERLTPESWHGSIATEPAELSLRSCDFINVIANELTVDFCKPQSTLALDYKIIASQVAITKGISLSKREIESLFYLCQGYTAKETATFLCVSSRTVELYLNNSRDKFGCRNKLALIHHVIEHFLPYLPKN